MIITRTPFRIAFFGAETTNQDQFYENKGQVLSATINKYCNISLKQLPSFFEHKHRLLYSDIELVNSISEINHPAIREIMKLFEIGDMGYEIQHNGDLPAKSGLGASSAFTVGLFNAFLTEFGLSKSKREIADKAIKLQKYILNEIDGSQDQIASSFGGFNKITFDIHGSYLVEPVSVNYERLNFLNSHLLLFYSGSKNTPKADLISNLQKAKLEEQKLKVMQPIIEQALSIMINNTDIKEFGFLMDEAWNYNRSLYNEKYLEETDYYYNYAKNSGALGGKVLGGQACSFLLFFAPTDKHKMIIKKLSDLIHVPFKFENQGTHCIKMK